MLGFAVAFGVAMVEVADGADHAVEIALLAPVPDGENTADAEDADADNHGHHGGLAVRGSGPTRSVLGSGPLTRPRAHQDRVESTHNHITSLLGSARQQRLCRPESG